MKNAEQYGIKATDVSIDLAKMQASKNKIISTLVSGVQSLLVGNKVEVIKGRAKLTPSRQIEIDTGQGQEQTIQAKKTILTTGGKPITLPIPGADSPSGIINAESILDLDYIPKSLLMIGGGVIGVEMATILAKLGCQITIVEMLPHILPMEDTELTSVLARALKEDGIQLYEGTKVSSIEDSATGKLVTISTGDTEKKLEAEVVAIAVGYCPNVDGLGLNEAGIAVSKGGIQVNERMETSVSNIYAAGDAIGGIMLAYVAMEEGVIAAENTLGRKTTIDYQAVPRCTFTLPELASVGLTEEEATAQGYQIKVGRFPFTANGMAIILGERRGLVKIIAEQKYGQILGVHIIGPQATGLIAEATLAMKLEASPQEIVATIHAHPTLSEALREAALDVTGETIHFLPKKR
jgi:dihydrolipoamide dehydrogenase